MIYGHVNGQSLYVHNDVLASETIDKITAKFEFGPEWDGMTKVVFFEHKKKPYPFLLEDDAITADKHLNLWAGHWNVYVWGFELDVERTDIEALLKSSYPRLTTVVAQLTVENTGIAGTGALDQEMMGFGEQVLAAATQAKAKADEVVRRANEGEFDGKSVTIVDRLSHVEWGNSPSGRYEIRPPWDTLIFSDGTEVDVKSGKNGSDGKDYELTDDDKTEIAEQVNTKDILIVGTKPKDKTQMVVDPDTEEIEMLTRDDLDGLYVKPADGIPESDLADDVRIKLNSGGGGGGGVTKQTVKNWGFVEKTELPTVPSKLSELTDDSTHRVVTDAEKASWNGKSNFSGSYTDLTDKPNIPAPLDVQIAGESIVNDGVANIPQASSSAAGVVKTYSSYGIDISTSTGRLIISRATQTDIEGRGSASYKPITPDKLDYAVKAALCDGKGTAWSTTEQEAAQARLGLVSALGVGF